MNLKINFNSSDSLQYKSIIEDTLEQIKTKTILPDGELSISFIDENNIKTINHTFRNKDEATDVLTFPLDDDDLLGDIYICIKEVTKKATEYDINKEQQLVMTIAHAFAHLVGYDHNTENEKRIMEDYEDFLLKKV
jgi:probable rRNA maturation factor